MKLLLALALLALPPAACAQQLTVSAAASLTEAFREIGLRYETANPGVTLRFNFAASGVLMQQIEQGAPVDVVATADQETMDRAVERRRVDPLSRRDFAANSLVLVVPAQLPSRVPPVQSVQDLAGAAVRRVAIGKPGSVPAGRYSRQALESAHLWAPLEPKLVPADSVRQVLDYVARGEVEAGFVYRTDAALLGDKVRIVQTLSGHAPIRYPVAVVAGSRAAAAARDFAGHLMSAEAQAVLAKFGFGRP